MIAVICGTPIPATTRVVQIDPGPIPIFTQSAPASISAFAPAPVATLPAITWRSGNLSLTILTTLNTFAECPCAESTTITSTWAFTNACTRSKTSAVIPTPAPHNNLPWSSFAAFGYLICFSISLIVINPFKLKSSSTIGNFSFLAFPKICFASSNVIPSLAVTSPSEVIDSLIFLEKSVSNFKSRFVIIPTSFVPSVIGTPEIRYFAIKSSASWMVCSGDNENGSVITPFSERFTLSTSSACSSIDMFLCIIPIPPCLAIAIAMRCSVTVSMLALISGIFNWILFVNRVRVSTSFAITSENAGTNKTSSNVIPSPINLPIFLFSSLSCILISDLYC